VHSIFAETAFLAGRAIEAATELQRMPGMSAEAFAETLDFWRRVREPRRNCRPRFTRRKQHARGGAGHIPLAPPATLVLASLKERARTNEGCRVAGKAACMRLIAIILCPGYLRRKKAT